MRVVYIEPENYFPEEIMKDCKLGEYYVKLNMSRLRTYLSRLPRRVEE